ncbi:MAG TPA: DUF3426 domain-containing protein [Steroidobacteraceae bacterium]|jgi:predicted Zn finger-like uncharacterized protein|nr:DUF3426 domain-containing protein [Steroidobacteraceae bacterium]
MFTVCSKCNLRLTVTATDLRAAQGYVRCGRCHNVFNALAALADDPARLNEQAGAADTQSSQALTPPAPVPQPAAPEPLGDAAATDTSLEFNPASTNINEVFIEAAPDERTGTFESVILGGEDPAEAEIFEEPVIAPQALSAPAAPVPTDHSVRVDVRKLRDALAEPSEAPLAHAATPLAADSAPPAVDDEISFMTDWSSPTRAAREPPGVDHAAAAEITDALEARDARATTTAAEEPAPAEPEMVLLDATPAGARVPRWLLRGAAAVLALCLLAQAVHHYRGDLADTALLRGPLNALYLSLGQPLEPRWDIASYEVRQLGASTDEAAPGELVVRASISNRAKRVQPLPLLRVVMQDRFGNRVAARDLKPAEYLGRGAPPVTLMAPGQRVDLQVAFQDPGRSATGFEIDACMARRDHTVSCANDPSSR